MKVGARTWVAAYLVVIAAFLVTVATYYHPGFGFTALIEFPQSRHDLELPVVKATPHVDHPDSGGYDGQFYAQLALDPLLKDHDLDEALDTAPYRARRILMSWVSYAAGLGQPAAVLQVYALHAVAAWLLLAWLITRWIPPTTGRGFALASSALLAHGPMMSVRYALPDLAAAVLIAAAVLAAERNRTAISALLLGAAGLTRDTSLAALGLVGGTLRRSPASWLRAALLVLLAVAPLLVWFDYIFSIYRTRTLLDSGHFVAPFSGLWWKLSAVIGGLAHDGLTFPAIDDVTALTAFVAQGAWLVWLLVRHRDTSPWVLTGLGFVALALVVDQAVWEGAPGAYPRVLLPLTLAAHVTLARTSRSLWWLVVLIGLDVVPGIRVLA